MGSSKNLSSEPMVYNTDLNAQKRAGTIVFLLLFGFGGIWAATAPIDGAALAPGTVMVRSYSKIIQHLEGGIISNIFVENGARVFQGDPILELDNTQALAQLEIASTQHTALKALETRLVAERDNLPDLIYPEAFASQGEKALRESVAQKEIFMARKSALNGGIAILEQRIDQLESQISGLLSLQDSKKVLTESYEDEIRDVRELLEQGFSDKNRLRDLERSITILKGEVAELSSNIASAQVLIGESRLQILQQEKEFLNETVTELSTVQTGLNDAVERVTILEDVLSRTVVRAPDSGLVNGLQVHTIGGIISPGMRIVDIVPETDDLVIEARVSAVDIDRVAIGQEATIRFSTFGSGTVPTVFGRVITISADSFVDEFTGSTYYLARVELTEESVEDLSDLTLIPGMPAEVFIATGSRTLLEYLFKPVSNALARGLRED